MTTNDTDAARLLTSLEQDERRYGQAAEHDGYTDIPMARLGRTILPRRVAQMRVLIVALGWFSDDNRTMYGDKARAALDAAWKGE